MNEKRKIIYSAKECLFCCSYFTPSNSKQSTCGWRCRFMLLQSDFTKSTQCWEWPLSKNPQTGYGQFHTDGEEKRNQSAHRLSYILNVGNIPDGLTVMHSCDNRSCFNPDHLSVGTQKENLQDMRRKGRAVAPEYKRLEAHPNSKLNVAAVIEIRESALSNSKLAEKFGVSKSAIQFARSGSTWVVAPPQSDE